MNKLKNKDCYRTSSHEDRVMLLEELKNAGLTISETTWRCRNSKEASGGFPIIAWKGNGRDKIVAHVGMKDATLHGYDFNPMTREEFLCKAGASMKPMKNLKRVEL